MKKNQILIVGPEYRNHRGGIGAVIAEHKMLFSKSKFYSSYNVLPKFQSIIYGIFKMVMYPFYLTFNPSVKIVHIHGASRGSFYRKYYYFLLSKYLFSKKVIYHIHGGEFHLFINESTYRIQKRIQKIIYKSDRIVVLSDWWVTFFTNQFPGINVTRIYNSVPTQVFKKTYEPKGKINFLFLGRISNNKGCYDLMEVAENLINQKLDFVINIGGNGETDKLQELIQKKNLRGHVNYVGWVSGEKKTSLLHENDVYVLPSRNEGLPVSILEAMSFGMPIISTNVGGIPEMVEDSVSGFIIEPGNITSLTKKMTYFIEHKERIQEMGSRSKVIVKNKFSSEIIKEELWNLYTELLKVNPK